jgi:hypothetical protein
LRFTFLLEVTLTSYVSLILAFEIHISFEVCPFSYVSLTSVP